MKDIPYPNAGMFWNWLIWQASSYDPFPEWSESLEKQKAGGQFWGYCTCHRCIGHWECEWDGEYYNIDGDCLAMK